MMNNRTLSIPKRPDRGSFREPNVTGTCRILLKPTGRRERRKYYAVNSDGMHWTEFREIASDFQSENIAYGVAARIIANNARLRDKVVVVPA